MKRKMLLCFVLTLFIGYVQATKVSPVRFDVSIARGSSQEFKLNLMGSKGDYNQNILIYPSDLFMNRTGALSFDTIPNKKNSCIEWVKMESNKISLLEDQSKELKFKISIPFNATPGEYYAVIMVEPEKFSNLKGKQEPIMLQMKSRVAVVVVLDVPGRTYIKKGEVTEVKILDTDSLVGVSATFKNNGDIHLDVLGEAVIRSTDGRTNYGKFALKALSSAKDAAFIFPEAIRDFEGALKRQLPAGDYLVEVSFNYGYEFKKAHLTQKFSIKRTIPVKEEKAEFLRVNNQDLKLIIPAGGRRTQVLSLTNIDYRPLKVNIESDNWIKVTPDSLILKTGEVRNIMLTMSVAEYDNSQKKESVILFKTDRGLSSKTQVLVSALKEKLISTEVKNNQKKP
jgi:uncharacterized membrane protein